MCNIYSTHTCCRQSDAPSAVVTLRHNDEVHNGECKSNLSAETARCKVFSWVLVAALLCCLI